MALTRAQVDAIEYPGRNLQLIACAGSGKTEVVARRVVHLLSPDAKKQLAPRNIVAFTFTEKAAAELKDRIVTRAHERFGEINGLAEMFVGTIHGFCLDLLKSEVPKYLKYEVLNEVQQRLFVDRHSKMSGLTACTDLQGAPLRRYVDTKRYIDALSILQEAERNESKLKKCSLLDGLDAYRGLLEERSYLDYTSILDAAVDAMTNDEALKTRLQERIKYLIVDEYQDVNPIQEAVVWLLHELGAGVCVVGDDDQTIYQWRGSDVENILTFKDRYPGAKTIPLEENFRSSEGIVTTARAFIEQNQARLAKSMTPANGQKYEPGDLVALSFDSPEEEADHIASVMKSLHGVAIREPAEGEPDRMRGISWSDMAVLLRSVAANGDPITQALDRAEIPYVVGGMNNLFETKEAEAARQLFYFMASSPGVTAAAVSRLWLDGRMGLEEKAVKSALRKAAETRAQFDTPKERFGFYSVQKSFLAFIEDVGLREEKVPRGRGDVVFYNLGKFSQLISDFESIHFHSDPKEKYRSFAGFLEHQADGAYPEGWQDNQYANPNAVRIMTVHQAKGMQWPAVFIPALLRNRFPSKRQGGRTVWHLLPREGIKGQARYEGTIEDERRLFYVAMTRSQKFLHMTWAPVTGNQLFQRPSEFWDQVLGSKWVKRRPQDYSGRKRLPATPKAGVANVVLSFSDMKYFFECPYQFKLRILYGFNAPIHEALGYGKSLHDALAEVHARAIRGEVPDPKEVPRLVETHLHAPYAYPALKKQLEKSATQVLRAYLVANRALFPKIEFAEKAIEINLDGGVTVVGRIDLVRRIDTGETTIVDLKSTDRAQAEDVTETQLHIYALGYEDLTGRKPDFVEIYELDEGKRKSRSVDEDFIADVRVRVQGAANALREGQLEAQPVEKKCRACDYLTMCSSGRKAVKS